MIPDSWAVVEGDCVEKMRELSENSVDAVVTDPPAGIAFMNREWDRFGQRVAFVSFLTAAMRECCRVLKPGGHAVVWALPRTSPWTGWALEDAGFVIRDVVTHLFGSGFPKSHNLRGEWEGWGTALKPSAEFWFLARKPLSEKNVAANVQRWSVGGLNIDGTRVAYQSDADRTWKHPGSIATGGFRKEYVGGEKDEDHPSEMSSKGRWPPNVAVDEEAARMVDEQSGERPAGSPVGGGEPSRAVWGTSGRVGFRGHGDTGGASRFFYCPKADRAERNIGLDRPNTHPTLKPIALMEWLCKMVTPPGGLVLDPFCGSGSTGIAALRAGFRFLGVEKEPEYVEIAKARIQGDSPLFNMEAR